MSKSVKHTPGPWTLSEPFSNGFKELVEIMGDNHRRSVVFVDTDEGDGNAYLIAAAPELLEALEVARARLQHYADNLGGADLEIIEKAESAIAKARGEL